MSSPTCPSVAGPLACAKPAKHYRDFSGPESKRKHLTARQGELATPVIYDTRGSHYAASNCSVQPHRHAQTKNRLACKLPARRKTPAAPMGGLVRASANPTAAGGPPC